MAITSLFGPTPQQVMMARQKEAQEQMMLRNQQIAQQGGQFGAFAPLYQAGLRFGDVATQAAMQGLFPQQADPALQQASAIQSVLSKYSDQDQSSPEVLTKIGRELMSVAPDAGIKALTLAQQLSKEDKLITAKPGERIFRRGAGGALEMVAEIPDDEDPLKAASRDKFREIYSRYPDTPEGRAQAAVEFRNWDNKFKENVSAAGRLTFDTPKDRFAAITEVNNQVKPFVTQINTLDQAIALRIKDKSPFSQAVFTQVVGSAFGDSQKAQQEILRLVNTGNLGQRVTNTLNLFLSGDIGQATKEDQLESLNAIREYAANQMDTTLTPYRMAAGEKADEVAPLSSTRFKRPVLGPGKQYIPFTVIQQYNLQKGQQFKTGGKTYIYNGDGTVSLVGEK